MVFFATVEETDGNLFTGLEISSDAQDTVRGGGGEGSSAIIQGMCSVSLHVPASIWSPCSNILSVLLKFVVDAGSVK